MARFTRKGWVNLSPAYQRRLLRAGITQDLYEQGASINKARGHKPKPKTKTKARDDDTPIIRKAKRLGLLVIWPEFDWIMLPSEREDIAQTWVDGFMTSGPLGPDDSLIRISARYTFMAYYEAIRGELFESEEWETFRGQYDKHFGR